MKNSKKSIIMNAINAETVGNLSEMLKAELAIKKIGKEYAEKFRKLTEKREKLIAERSVLLKQGRSLDDVMKDTSTAAIDEEMGKLNTEKEKALAPFKATLSRIFCGIQDEKKVYLVEPFVPNDLYTSYKSMIGNPTDATEKAYKDAVKRFLVSIGAQVETEKAFNTFYVLVNGARATATAKTNKDGKTAWTFITARSQKDFAKTFMHTLLWFAVTKRKVLEVKADGTVCRVKYPAAKSEPVKADKAEDKKAA